MNQRFTYSGGSSGTARQKAYMGGAIALLMGVWLAGCSSTLQGAREDVSKDTSAVGSAAHHAAVATKTAAENAGSALTLTPRIKTAIIRDPVLNDKRNQINVGSTNTVVTLRGHVADADMKRRATEDAEAIISKHHAPQKVVNELTVQ